jgi:hypothetical protein
MTLTRSCLMIVAVATASAALPARAQEGSPADVLAILQDKSHASVRAALDPKLGPAVDGALSKLKPSRVSVQGEVVARVAHAPTNTLGIGQVGDANPEVAGYDSIYGRGGKSSAKRSTQRVQEVAEDLFARLTHGVANCYGDPLRGDGNATGIDSLVVAVEIDSKGKVLTQRTVKPTRAGQAGAEECVVRLVQEIRFPARRVSARPEVLHRWFFQLSPSVERIDLR